MNKQWEIRKGQVDNIEFYFACHNATENHPSWYSFQDEQSVRERWWKINPGSVVIDAGSAYGSYALPALAQGASKVFCWSPESDEYDLLTASAAVNGWLDKIVIRRDGLWSEPGYLIPHSYERPPEFFTDKNAAEIAAVKYVRVRDEPMPRAFAVNTLDKVILEHQQISRVDWLKLDVEGAEIEVLKGAEQLLRIYRPNVLVENHIFKDAAIKDKVADFLLSLDVGYSEIGTIPYHAISHSLYTSNQKLTFKRQSHHADSPSPLKVALVLGKWSTQSHPPFDTSDLYNQHALTGSESFFFNTVRGLQETGCEVTAFCDCVASATISGAAMLPLANVTKIATGFDAVLSWNEPDQLRLVTDQSTLRICVQQVNDFGYCAPGFDRHVDLYCFPSEMHRKFMVESCHLNPSKTDVIPNSINLEFFDPKYEVVKHSIAYCSSPDRGLHWLLDFFPEIRKRVPDATLWIYYDVDRWRNAMKDSWEPSRAKEYPHQAGIRARYINEALKRLEGKGVNLVGLTPTKAMTKRLTETDLFVYPCDTVTFTEGFSVATLDACAAGCFPIISDCDAIASVHGHAAKVILGNPGEHRDEWIETIVQALQNPERDMTIQTEHARAHSREAIAARWKALIENLVR